jgi:hypothetical protein
MNDERMIHTINRLMDPDADSSGWVVAGFDAVCFWGDWITPEDIVQYVWLCGWEHKECHDAERPMFQGRNR